MPYLDQDTIRLLDDVEPWWCIQIMYLGQDGGERMAIGMFSHCDKDSMGDWCIYRKNAFVGIRLVDVISIERVGTKERA